MKKLLYFAAALLTFAACEKEVEAPVEKATPATYKVTIKAGFADETKTAYDAAGKFSWVAGDKIGVMVQKEGELKQVTFTAKSAGAVTEFEGEVEEGWTVAEYASYPFTGVTEGYARNDFAWDKSNGEEYGWRLWGSIKPDLENPLASTPLIAKKDAEGYYSFKTATAIVKFTVENVPYETAYAYLEVPSATKEQYNLNGWYSLNDEGLPTMATAIEPWENRYNWNAPTDYNQTMDYYFFIPEGKLPAGTKFELCNSSWAAIKSFEVKQDVEILRNRVTNIAPVEIEAYKPELEENQIWIKPWNISVNSDCTKFDGTGSYEGGTYKALVDGNAETYWHSAWYSGYTNEQGYYNPATDFDAKYGITIDIKLEEPLKDFKISYYTRHNNNNGEPREIIFAGSNDGNTWTDIETVANDELMKVAAGARVDLPVISAAEAFSYLRIGITKAGNGDTPNDLTAGGNSTAIAELLLFNAGEVTPPEPKNVDVLNYANIGVTGTTYTDWTLDGATGAKYAGTSAGGNESIQINNSSNKTYGFVNTTSVGLVRKIKVTWNTNTTATRNLFVYGSNEPYTSVADIYDVLKRGTVIAYLEYASEANKVQEVEIKGDYAYVGVLSAKSAQYLDAVEITWDLDAVATPVTSTYTWDFGSDEWQTLFAGVGAANTDLTNWHIINDGLEILSLAKSKYNAGYIQFGGGVQSTNNRKIDRYFSFDAPKDGYVMVVASNTGESEAADRLVTIENNNASESLVGGVPSTAPTNLIYQVKAGRVVVYPTASLRFYKILFSETDPTPEEGGSGVPDYDPITGFEW